MFSPASALRIFKSQGQRWIFTEMIACVVAIGLADLLTGYEISVFIFYAGPILAVAWYCDKKRAILLALLSGLVWWWADGASGHLYDYSWLHLWETFVRLSFFLLAAFAGAAFRSHSDAAESRIRLLEYSQELEHEIINISERERRRIGQDLHDGICQNLAALGCAATSLRGDLEQKGVLDDARVAGELAKLLQDAVVQTRDLARGLVPVQMDDAGLASALQNLAASVTKLQGIECTFEATGPFPNGDQDSAVHLYRIAQEAINNATRHGQARKIAVSLDATDRLTTLRITDNGVGMSKTNASHDGVGLNIMSYRARLSGGELKITEPEIGGTVVSCVLPSGPFYCNETGV